MTSATSSRTQGPRCAPSPRESSDEVLRLARGYDAIGIDEVQFFDEGIVDAIDGLVTAGARVVAAGLAQDFRGLPFGAMPTLLCVAEFVDKLEAVCHRCGGPPR